MSLHKIPQQLNFILILGLKFCLKISNFKISALKSSLLSLDNQFIATFFYNRFVIVVKFSYFLRGDYPNNLSTIFLISNVPVASFVSNVWHCGWWSLSSSSSNSIAASLWQLLSVNVLLLLLLLLMLLLQVNVWQINKVQIVYGA